MISRSQSLRRSSVNRPVVLGLASAGLFVAALDAYVVVAALLPMLTSMHIPVNHLERATPIVTAFLFGYLALMPLAGGLSDRFGRLPVFASCLLIFAIGSLLTATSGSLGQLIAGRLLQGAGGGALVPIVLALAADYYAGERRSPVLGAVSALQEVGSVLGPLWGGLLAAASAEGWRWVFWVNLPVCAVLLWALWPQIGSGRSRANGSVDWLGGLLAAAGLGLLTLALYAQDPEHSPVGPGFPWQLPLALLFFALFVLHERRVREPIVDVRDFRDSSFTGAALTNGIAGAGLMMALVYVPVLAESQVVFSMNPRQAALLLFRLMIGIPIGALLGGWLAARLRSYRFVAFIGLALAALGFIWLSGWDQTSLAHRFLSTGVLVAHLQLLVTGLGLGLEIAPVSAALLDAVAEARRGAAASFLVVMRLLGMLVGLSLLAGFGLYHFHQVTAHLQPPSLLCLGSACHDAQVTYFIALRKAVLDQYHLIFRATAILVGAGALLALLTLRPLRRAAAIR